MANRRRYNSGVIEMTPEWVKQIVTGPHCSTNDGKTWVPARPIAFQSVRERVRATWLVWTGRADALVWPGNQ